MHNNSDEKWHSVRGVVEDHSLGNLAALRKARENAGLKFPSLPDGEIISKGRHSLGYSHLGVRFDHATRQNVRSEGALKFKSANFF